MTAQILPTRTDAAHYDFEIELEGRVFVLAFEWNDRDAGWYLSILDSERVQLLGGKRIVLGYPLANIHLDPRLPPGTFVAIDTSSTDVEPGLGDLGDRVKLVYIPSSDL